MVIESTDMNVSIPFLLRPVPYILTSFSPISSSRIKNRRSPKYEIGSVKKGDLHTSQYESQEALFFSNLQEDASSNPIVIV